MILMRLSEGVHIAVFDFGGIEEGEVLLADIR